MEMDDNQCPDAPAGGIRPALRAKDMHKRIQPRTNPPPNMVVNAQVTYSDTIAAGVIVAACAAKIRVMVK
jgi:hypothetical protein